MLVHKLSKGVTQAAVASIPCRPDLRQVRFEVQHSNIKNPALAAALQDFTDDCYSRALYDWKAKDQGKTQDGQILQDITLDRLCHLYERRISSDTVTNTTCGLSLGMPAGMTGMRMSTVTVTRPAISGGMMQVQGY